MKRPILLFSVLICLISKASGTGTSNCFNFDDSIIGTSAYVENPIDSFNAVGQPFENWMVINGSPSIYKTGQYPGFTAASGTQSLILAACGSNSSEGAAYGYGFRVGRIYQITFKHRYIYLSNDGVNPPIDTVNLILANGLVHNEQGGCGPTASIPSGSQVVFSRYNYGDTIWRTDTINITSLTTDYQYVWIRINTQQGLVSAGDFVVDDFCVSDVTPINTCFNFDDSIFDLPAYNQDPIEAFNGVGQAFENWIVTSGSPSIIATGDFPGFAAASGSQSLIFAACGGNNSEGAAYAYSFLAGRSYELTFKNRFISFAGNSNPPIDSVNVILANGLVDNEQGGCSLTPAIPAGSLVVYCTYNYNDTIWQTETIHINNLSNSYGFVWFRVNVAQGLGTASDFVLDDFCIDDVTPVYSNCFNFDDTELDSSAYNQDPIENFKGPSQPFENWIVVNGSPSIIATGDFPGFTAASGTQSLLFAACGSDNSEGAAYNYHFAPGGSYEVIYKHRFISFAGNGNPAIDSINVILANGLVDHEQGGCGPTVAIPAGSLILSTAYNYNDTIWRSDTLYVNNLTGSYTYLWFRINVSQSMGTASDFVIDDLCIEGDPPLAIREINDGSDMTIYPDPATDIVNISTGAAATDKYTGLTIVNMEGQQITATITNRLEKSFKIDTSHLPDGQYILLLKSDDGTEAKRFSILR